MADRETFTVAALPQGRTRYHLRGRVDAPAVLLVFGGFHFPRNCDLFFDELAAALGERWAVLTYDAYGRGGSAAPEGPYDEALYLAQVDALLDKLGLSGRPLCVLGYSFGGAVSTHFVARHPARVRAWVLSGAWGLWTPLPWIGHAFVRLGLGRVFWWLYQRALPASLRAGFNQPRQNADRIAHMLAVERGIDAENPGNLRRALLSTFRWFSRDTRAVALRQAPHPRPVLLAWGEDDAISPSKHARALAGALPQAELTLLDGNHNDLWLEPGRVERLQAVLVDFLRAQEEELVEGSAR